MLPLRKPTLTAPDRLRPLLGWINGDPVMAIQVRVALVGFVGSFDGSPEAGFVDVRLARLLARLDEPHPAPAGTLAEQLETLRLTLREVLHADASARSFPSLRIGIHRVRTPTKRSTLKPRERQAYQEAGAAVLRVEGSLLDVVPFLLMHLLTAAPGMMTVARCPAPQAGHWRDRCGRWFVQAAGRGRPREYCTDACRVRANYATPDEPPSDEPPSDEQPRKPRRKVR